MGRFITHHPLYNSVKYDFCFIVTLIETRQFKRLNINLDCILVHVVSPLHVKVLSKRTRLRHYPRSDTYMKDRMRFHVLILLCGSTLSKCSTLYDGKTRAIKRPQLWSMKGSILYIVNLRRFCEEYRSG